MLVVEDDPRLLDILTRHLDRIGYATRGVRGAAAALQALEESPADVVLSDVRMPGMDGRTFLGEVRERHPASKVVLMTAFGSVEDAVEAMRAGHTATCEAFQVETVAAVLRNAARELELDREVETLRRAVKARFTADRLIGKRPHLRGQAGAARGGRGGARPGHRCQRHGQGARRPSHPLRGTARARPFVAVNCAAIPEQLFESTMFGHRSGAFTGAVDSQVGLVEQSSGGTLFLDEVAEIPASHQAKLLRVLQESELRPSGARPVRVTSGSSRRRTAT